MNSRKIYKENFTELNKIDEGSFGCVFKVSHKIDKKFYAIKIIKFEDSAFEKIEKGARTLSQLDDKYVVKYYSSWSENNELFIQTELCSYNLFEFIEKKKIFFNRSNGEAISKLEYFITSQIFRDIIKCVQYLHENNPVLMHRDLKPQNILIKENAENNYFIKLCDFGLAKSTDPESRTHTRGVGTKNYTAPEVYRGKYSFRADIYSLGVIASDLFDYDFNPLNPSINIELTQNWEILHKLIDSMVVMNTTLRPTCAHILMEWMSLSININKIDADDIKNSNNPDDFIFKYVQSIYIQSINEYERDIMDNHQLMTVENKFIPAQEEVQLLDNEKRRILIEFDVTFKTNVFEFEYNQRRIKLLEKLVKIHKRLIVADILQIKNRMRKPQNSPAIGIVLGVTESLVAYLDTNKKDNVIIIPNEFNEYKTPSYVFFRDNNNVIVGNAAKDNIHAYSRNTISFPQRLIGRKFEEQSVQRHMNLCSYKVIENQNHKPIVVVEVEVDVEVDGLKRKKKVEKSYTPEEISAQILIKIKSIAENYLGFPVNKTVITVPAYFNNQQIEATRQAGVLAGLEILGIIDEPTAAAIAFNVDRNDYAGIRKVLIYDFGCQSLIVSILEINEGKIELMAVTANENFSGNEIDSKFIEYCLQKFKAQYNIEFQSFEIEAEISRLIRQCKEHKKRLSSVKSTVIRIENFFKKYNLEVTISRDMFEEMNNHFIESIDSVKTTLELLKIRPSDIDDIFLVGGSTRIPRIQHLLSEFFGGRSLNHSVNPDIAVAIGAAYHAALLNSIRNPIQLNSNNI